MTKIVSPKKEALTDSDLEESDVSLEMESFESNSFSQVSSEEDTDHIKPIDQRLDGMGQFERKIKEKSLQHRQQV